MLTKFIKNKKSIVFFITLSVIFCLLCTLYSCQSSPKLLNRVSELRSDVYFGKSENYQVSAHLGYRENPFINDGKVNKKQPYLLFRLDNLNLENATITISFNFDNNLYSEKFTPSPQNGILTANFNVENFNLTTFVATINVDSNIEQIQMQSLKTPKTLTHLDALTYLEKHQGNYLNSLVDINGNYTFELSLKILFKNDKSYWYVGIMTGNGKLKALLIDGENGNVLAVREVF